MTDYDNTNRGVLFKNDRKETESHPDYTGSLNVGGVEHWFSAWIKTSKSGNKFMSLSLGKPKDAAHKQGMEQARRAAAPVEDFDNSEIPF